MERTERRDTKEEWKFPKNVRQIGEPGQGAGRKILIEDYVYTYLRQLAEGNLTCMKTAVLLGKAEGEEALCIRGAVEAEMGPTSTGAIFSGKFSDGLKGKRWWAGIWPIRAFRRC